MRVRVVIRRHDGSPQKPRFWKILSKLGLSLNKLIETKDAFIVITDDETAEDFFDEDKMKEFKDDGFEPQMPLELLAKRTLVLRGVDPYITDMSDDELTVAMTTAFDKIIRIPSNPTMLKLVAYSVATANYVLEKGIRISNQIIPKGQIELERFVNIRQCMRCYSYSHVTKKCNKPSDFVVCSECSSNEHRFKDCLNLTKKCLNCRGPHRSLVGPHEGPYSGPY